MEDEINLIDLWRIVWKYRLLTVTLTFLAVSITGIISLKMPKLYKATASVLPQIEMARVAVQQPVGLGSGVLNTMNPLTNIVVALLKSERMRRDVITKFNLMEFYKTETLEEASDRLEDATKISVSKEEVVSVSFICKDPQLAADVANYYVAHLDQLNEQLKITPAKPMVTLLDPARIPEIKYRPIIRLNIAIAGVSSAFICLFLSFFLDYVCKLRATTKDTQKMKAVD